MNATITTAARRIARDINTTAPSVTAYYDAEGHLIETISTGSWLVSGTPEGAVAKLAGRRGQKITEAEVQHLLDTAAKVGACEGVDFDIAVGL